MRALVVSLVVSALLLAAGFALTAARAEAFVFDAAQPPQAQHVVPAADEFVEVGGMLGRKRASFFHVGIL